MVAEIWSDFGFCLLWMLVFSGFVNLCRSPLVFIYFLFF